MKVKFLVLSDLKTSQIHRKHHFDTTNELDKKGIIQHG
jgi:hypothetical protein